MREPIDVETAIRLYNLLGDWKKVAGWMSRRNGAPYQAKSIAYAVRQHDLGVGKMPKKRPCCLSHAVMDAVNDYYENNIATREALSSLINITAMIAVAAGCDSDEKQKLLMRDLHDNMLASLGYWRNERASGQLNGAVTGTLN